jgi:hypothetical protein
MIDICIDDFDSMFNYITETLTFIFNSNFTQFISFIEINFTQVLLKDHFTTLFYLVILI